jgi:hypothetical protein
MQEEKKPVIQYGFTAPSDGQVYLRPHDNRRLVVMSVECTLNQGQTMWLRIKLFDCADNIARVMAWHEWFDAVDKKQLVLHSPQVRETSEALEINKCWAMGHSQLTEYTNSNGRIKA